MARRKTKPALPEHLLEAVARRFRALAVPSRLRILNALMEGPLGMGELAAVTGLEQSNLSRQVTELEREGCVVRRREGRTVAVEIGDETLHELCALMCGAVAARQRAARRSAPAVSGRDENPRNPDGAR